MFVGNLGQRKEQPVELKQQGQESGQHAKSPNSRGYKQNSLLNKSKYLDNLQVSQNNNMKGSWRKLSTKRKLSY
jgi:hypothetical protein